MIAVTQHISREALLRDCNGRRLGIISSVEGDIVRVRCGIFSLLYSFHRGRVAEVLYEGSLVIFAGDFEDFVNCVRKERETRGPPEEASWS